MNATGNTGGLLGPEDTGGFGYGVGVSVGILLLITSITSASYFCFCSRSHPPPSSAAREGRRNVGHAVPPPDLPNFVIDVGLDEEIINSYPKLPYSEAKALHKTNSTSSSCCSICLADYKATDLLRQLPDCGHLFHVKCVDPWLRLHPTCPVCRTSPIPTPLSTPLAEVVPLATRRD